MIGKLPPDALAEHVLARAGAEDGAVLQGPAYGEDAAAIDLGDRVLVASTDPVSMAAERIGTLGVDVACNDVAASGADPRWLTVALFLPDDGPLEAVTRQLDGAARRAGVAVVGGHTEYAPDRDRPLVVLGCMGLAEAFVPTGGADPGDRIVLTKGAAIEATAILATDFRDEFDLPARVLDRAAGFFDDVGVVLEARALRGHASAMHDPTEGGVAAGLVELAAASGVRLAVERDAIPVREETRRLCDAMGIDPLRVFGSGALLAAVPPADVDAALAALDGTVEAAVVGTAREADEPGVAVDGERVAAPVRDEMYALWE